MNLKPIKILSDSICDLSDELLQQYDIDLIPLGIIMGDMVAKDRFEIQQEDIFAWVEAHDEIPTTSACNQLECYGFLHGYAKDGVDILYIGLGAGMSSTYTAMASAAKEVMHLVPSADIRVIDSENLSTGIGLLVIKAAKMAKAGHSLDEIEAAVRAAVPQVRASFVVDTARYLYMGGRCSSVAAVTATTLKIKPRISVVHGVMEPTKKYRGKLPRVFRKYVRDLEDEMRQSDGDVAFVTHTVADLEIVSRVVDEVKALGIFAEVHVTRAGGVIACHCGPGTLGVLFLHQ